MSEPSLPPAQDPWSDPGDPAGSTPELIDSVFATPTTLPSRRVRVGRVVALGAAMVALLVAFGTAGFLIFDRDESTEAGLDRLNRRDVGGGGACISLVSWLTSENLDSNGQPYRADVIRRASAGWAVHSTTPEIRATVTMESGSPAIADLGQLYRACQHAGINMPEYKPPAR